LLEKKSQSIVRNQAKAKVKKPPQKKAKRVCPGARCGGFEPGKSQLDE